MTKRNDHILILLADSPWWVSVFFALIVYVVLAYIAPIWLVDMGVLGESLAQTSVKIAPLFGVIFLIPAFVSLIKHRRKGL
ncbi:hypothetical protein G5S52_16125 [Grimontia sp. S25]|uniref:Uncharacterized protein n=1 Tax=Grimontia sedimenti TaxID=2711294 RepID=A0A6M1RNQ2_9GAMM|nr:hypothetical protein [Grimontia sedimenti]NGN99119.1 hypothetical protein [Grimontia sedimenti]